MRDLTQTVRPRECDKATTSDIGKRPYACVSSNEAPEMLMPAVASGSKDAIVEDDEEDEGEELTASMEARVPSSLTAPEKHTQVKIDEHNLTHLPYRSWCPICVSAAGREDRHMGRTDEVEEGELTTVGMDYNFISDGLGAGHEDEIKALVLKDFKTGMLWAHRVDKKGPQDKWAVKKVVSDIEFLGRSELKMKIDGEPAIKAFQSAVIAARPAPNVIIPVNPPDYDPQANGCIEKGVQDVNT